MKTMNWKSTSSINGGFWKDQNEEEEDELDYEPVATPNSHLTLMEDIIDDNISTNFREIPDTSHLQNSLIDSDEETDTISFVTTETYSYSQSLRNSRISTNISKYSNSNINSTSSSSSLNNEVDDDCADFDSNAAAPILKSRKIDAGNQNPGDFTIKVNNNSAPPRPVEPMLVDNDDNRPKIQQKCVISTKFFDQFSSIADEDEEQDAVFSDDSYNNGSESQDDDMYEQEESYVQQCTFWKEKFTFDEVVPIRLKDNIFKYTSIEYANEHNLISAKDPSENSIVSKQEECLENVANSSVANSSGTDSVFKVPSMANVPKRKARPVEEEVSSTDYKDDVLSIQGSEVSDSNQEDMIIESVSMADSNQLITSTQETDNPNLNKTRIQILDNSAVENPEMKIKSWLQDVDVNSKQRQRPVEANPKQRLHDLNATVFRNSICYKYFIYKTCFAVNCPRNHGQHKGSVVWTLEKADEEMVSYSYTVMRHYDRIFQSFYTDFANEYINRDSLCDILTILVDSFFVQGVKPLDVFDYVVKLFEERSVMNFEDAIDYIVIQIGLNKQPLLLDIILTLIGDRKDISDDWDILKRITLGCKVELRPQLIENIIQNAIATYPMKLNICRQIQTIVDRKLIDLSKIPAELVKALENLARFHNLNLNHANPLPSPVNRSSNRSISSLSSTSNNSNNECYGLVPNNSVEIVVNVESTSQSSESAPNPIAPRQLQRIDQSPVFGQLKLNNYNWQNRLHYHLKNTTGDKTEMQDNDIRSLDQIISSRNGQGFLYFLNKYRNEQTVITHFIGMTVAQLKSQKGEEIESLLRMLNIAGSSDPNLFNDPKRSALIEVISLNMLVERGLVNNSSFQLLKLFPDWDTLCTSQLLGKIRLSHMGKYIYILKILVHNNKFQLAFYMLNDENLKLLSHSSNWPYEFTPRTDVDSRNKVLDKFFQNAYRKHVDLIIEMYRIVFEGRNISEYDATIHINDIFRFLIEEKNVSVLRKLHNHFDMFHTYLDRNVFRAYVVVLLDVLSENEKYSLYEKGVLKGVYKFYDGCEKEVIVRTDMHNNEIYLILKFFLRQLNLRPCKNGFEIVIQAADWSSSSFYQNNISKNCRSVSDINANVVLILQRDFNINVQKCDNSAYLVVSDKEVYQQFKTFY